MPPGAHIRCMASKRMKEPAVRPSDLPTKIVRASDGSVVRMKVVQANSPTLDDDLLAAFRSNVRRVRTEDRKLDRVAQDAAQG